MRSFRLLALPLLLSACAHAAAPDAPVSARTTAPEPAPATSSGSASAADATPSASPTTAAQALTRADCETLVRAGLGRVLSRVRLDPVMEAGRFVGYRLLDAQDLASWNAAGMDLRRGDVVTRVNGLRVDRPESAFTAFERLRIVPAIEVEVLRDGQPVMLRYVIRDAQSTASR